MTIIELILVAQCSATLLISAWIAGNTRRHEPEKGVTEKAIESLREMNTALLTRSGDDRDALMRLLPEGYAVMIEKHRLAVDLRKIEANEIKRERGNGELKFSIAPDTVSPVQAGWSDSPPARVM